MARPGKNNPNGEQKSPKRTPEVIAKLEPAFSIDASIGEACFFAGLSQSTFHEWMNDDPKLSERLTELRNKPVLKARMTVVKGLDEADNAKWYLERKRKKEFAQRVESTGEGGKDLIPQSEVEKSLESLKGKK